MRPLAARLRMRAGSFVIDNLYRGAALAARWHPLARPERHGVVVTADVAYRGGDRREHRLDVYRPRQARGPLPVVLYVHGGGFRVLSKDTHWIMGLVFARAGYLVLNVSYRLAPRHPFPAALEDVCDAYRFAVERAAEYGGDVSRLVVAGESAGANLACALAVVTAYRRPEPYARAAFDLGVQPRAVVPLCGILQVSDIGRLGRRRRLPGFVIDRLNEVSDAYLFGLDGAAPETLELADPLCILERDTPERPLPAFCASVGTRDPLLDDTRRLAEALAARGVRHEARYYDGQPHAFQAFVFRAAARDSWRHTFAFLDEVLAPAEASASPGG